MNTCPNRKAGLNCICPQCYKPTQSTKESILKSFDERFLEEGAFPDTPKETRRRLKEFLLDSLDKWGEEKYQEGLNIRRDYNDPELLKQFEQPAVEAYKKELIEKFDRAIAEKIKGNEDCPVAPILMKLNISEIKEIIQLIK